MKDAKAARLGIVVIGRDLGQRLSSCLRSVVATGAPLVYVDSSSSDGSDGVAIALDVPTIRLGRDVPLSASRGRNEGFSHLLREWPAMEFVQFVDGDCELDPGWLSYALDEMIDTPTLGIVCGHVRERRSGQDVVATLLDVEWRGPVGEIRACGGIFLARAAAFSSVGGFSTAMRTGEEAELCGRLLAGGWRIRRIDRAMCTHDADMRSIRDWLRRSVRVGRGFARSAALKGPSREPTMRGKVLSVLFWALVLPVLTLAGSIGALWDPMALTVPFGVVLLYLIQIARVAARQRRSGRRPTEALQYGFFCLVSKWAHLVGCCEHWFRLGAD